MRIVVEGDGEAEFSNVGEALAEPGTDLRIFAKPEVHGHRRMAVALAIRKRRATARNKSSQLRNRLILRSSDLCCNLKSDSIFESTGGFSERG